MWSEIVRRYGYNFSNFSPFQSPHATESITCYWKSLAPWEGKLINSLMMKPTAHGRVVPFTPLWNFNFERIGISDDCGWIILTSLSGIPTLFNYDSKAIAAGTYRISRALEMKAIFIQIRHFKYSSDNNNIVKYLPINFDCFITP